MNTENRITNLNYLDLISDGDNSFKKDIIETFLRNAPVQLAEMNEALQNQKWKKVGDVAHSLKPSFTLLGMESYKDIVLHIEHYGRNAENLNLIPGLIKDLQNLIDQVFVELNSEIDKL